MLQVIFWSPGEAITPSGLRVAVDKPTVLLVTERENEVEVTASTLEYAPVNINVKLGATINGEERSAKLQFAFPANDYVGQSVTQVVARP
jgi:hypothetical protein